MRGRAAVDASSMKVRCLIVALALSFAAPPAASAQSLRGQVVDSASQAPMSGVVLLLLDERGATKARGLTDEQGVFLLLAPGAGRYQVRALRIGFRPTTLATETLETGASVVRRFQLALVPVRLDTVRVTGRNLCRSASEQTIAIGALWEQARTALLATQVTAQDRPFGGTVIVYDRALKPGTQQVIEQQARIISGFTERLWGSATAEDLRRDGYVVSGDNQLVFHAPDLEVLLSPEFGEDHCFRIAETSDSSRVGIAFEPNQRRRNIPEIEGTLWIDRATSRLLEIAFTYRNVPLPDIAGKAGGRMQFAALRNDTWVISRWDIRMPLIASHSTQGLGGVNRILAGMNHVSEVKAMLVRGGELSLVTHGGDTLWKRAPIVVDGIVADSATGRPVDNATVRVIGLAGADTTANGGWFTLTDMLPGFYELRVSTPSLDSLGASHRTDLVITSDSQQVMVRVPTRASMLQMLCPQGVSGLDGIITGVVRLAGDTTRAPGVSVRAEWEVLTPRPDGVDRLRRSTSTRTNAHGIYRLCGVPPETNLAIIAEVNDSISGREERRLPATQRVAEVDLGLLVRTVVLRADTTETRRDRRYARMIRGIVRDTAGSLLDYVRVNVTPIRGTITDAEGEFSIGWTSQGGVTLDVRRIGYLPQRVELPPGGDTLVTIRLKTLAKSLETVRVEAAAISAALVRRGFYERQRDSDKGIARGAFFTAEDIERRNPVVIEHMLGDQHGLRLLEGNKLVGTMLQMGGPGGFMPVPCTPTIYVDGVRLNNAWGDATGNISGLLHPGAVAGIEVYARGVNAPPQHPSQNGGCAVIIVWSKS